jgi:hypothetical protein
MISAIFAALGGAKIIAIGGAIIAAVLSLFGIYKAGHSVGTAQANAKNATQQATIAVAEAEKSAAVRTETVKEASNVQTQVGVMSANAVADELREFERPSDSQNNAGSEVRGPNTNG